MDMDTSTINADGFGTTETNVNQRPPANKLYNEHCATLGTTPSKAGFKVWINDMKEKGYLNAGGKYTADDEGNYVDAATGQYPKDSNGKDIVSKSPPSDSSSSKSDKTKETLSKITEGLGTGIGLVTDVLGIVQANKKAKDNKGSKPLPDYTPKETSSTGAGGVPVIVWYGVGGAVVILASIFVYKNFIAPDSGTGTAATPAPAK